MKYYIPERFFVQSFMYINILENIIKDLDPLKDG